jgi:hypothetical protein
MVDGGSKGATRAFFGAAAFLASLQRIGLTPVTPCCFGRTGHETCPASWRYA